MSKPIGRHEWRELAHYVELDSGERYYLDSSYVEGRGFETIACRTNGNNVIYPGSDRKIKNYNTYDEMVINHYDLINHLETFVLNE